MELIKEDERGRVYQADNFKIFYRYKGTVSGDNSKNKKELIYLTTGSAKITLETNTRIAESPAKIEIPANTYHKIEALTDISFVLYD
ncbi:MAG: hypothetical protein ABH880_02815 [Patescibacteria group bacterium]